MQPASAGTESAFHLLDASIRSIRAALRSKEISCHELAQLYLARIAAYDQQGPRLNGVIMVNPAALQEADRVDAALRAGESAQPLLGIPVLVKDQFETRDMPTTFGSALFKDFVPGRDAAVVEKLKAAGALILAKNTMSEYAQPGYYGSAFGFCRNPYDLARSPGGSSCGTGASVAACFGVVGIGEDTGGSIRNPASSNALVGLRPTLGLASRFGMLPGSPTRDTLGPMTRSVADAAILLDVIAGYDPRDPATAFSVGHVPQAYSNFLTPDSLRGKRLGVVRSPLGTGIDPEAKDYQLIKGKLDAALAEMATAGAEILDPAPLDGIVDLLHRVSGGGEAEEAVDSYLADHPNAPVKSLREIVLSPEGLVHPGQRASLAAGLGHATTDLAHLQNQAVRAELRQEVLRLMADHRLDALVYATMDHYQPLIPDDIMSHREPASRSGSNSALSPAIGFPALTVPAGVTEDGFPVGLSFLGRPFSEGLLLSLGYGYEQTGRHRGPPASTPALPGEP